MMMIASTEDTSPRQGFILLLGLAEQWRDRALPSAIRVSANLVYGLASSVLNLPGYADGFIVAASMAPLDVISAIWKHQNEKQMGLVGVVPLFEGAIELGLAIAEEFGLPYNSRTAILDVRSKSRMREAFLRTGLASPQFVAGDASDVMDKAKYFKFPAVLKPESLGGSLGVEFVSDLSALPAKLERSSDAAKRLSKYGLETGRFILEEYIDSVAEVSVEVLNSDGHHIALAMIDKVMSAEPMFVELGHLYPSSFTDREDVKTLATAACKALGLTHGVAHVEIRIRPDGEPVLVEVNARTAGGGIPDIIEECGGPSLYDLHLKSFIGHSLGPDFMKEPRGSAAVTFMKAPEGVILDVYPDAISGQPDSVRRIYIWSSKGDKSHAQRSNFDRDGAIVWRWPDCLDTPSAHDLYLASGRLSEKTFRVSPDNSLD